MQLTFHERIPKTNSNNIISVPNLTHRGLILQHIQFESETWHFEVSVKCGSNDLMRLGTTYFQHSNSVDLSGHRARLEEGDRIEMTIKPKQAPKDLDMMICYTYASSLGSIYLQSSERLLDLGESNVTIISDIANGYVPTRLHIRSDVPLQELALVPKFTVMDDSTDGETDEDRMEYHRTFQAGESNYDLELDGPEFELIRPMLRYYQLQVKVDTSNVDAMIHFMARGFRV